VASVVFPDHGDEARRRQVAELGFVPAQPQLKLAQTKDADTWWKRALSIAEGS
jgi:hypothetical protein